MPGSTLHSVLHMLVLAGVACAIGRWPGTTAYVAPELPGLVLFLLASLWAWCFDVAVDQYYLASGRLFVREQPRPWLGAMTALLAVLSEFVAGWSLGLVAAGLYEGWPTVRLALYAAAGVLWAAIVPARGWSRYRCFLDFHQ